METELSETKVLEYAAIAPTLLTTLVTPLSADDLGAIVERLSVIADPDGADSGAVGLEALNMLKDALDGKMEALRSVQSKLN